MTQRLCPRCRHAVTFEQDGTLIYCSNCGAPQVRLSEELMEQMAAQQEAVAAGESFTSEPAAALEPGSVDWKGAIHCAALAGGVAFLLALLSIAVPQVSLLTFFWLLTAPVVTLGIYSARFRGTFIRPGFGARLGLLCGMAVVLGMSIVYVSEMLLVRYAFHHGAAIDGPILAIYDQARASAAQQPAPASAEIGSWLNNPERRAGLLLLTASFFIAMYLAFSAVGGAFAGLLRSRKPQIS